MACLLLVVAVVCAIPAQKAAPERGVVAGAVRQGDGTPWAGAKVTLRSLVYERHPELGKPDRVEVHSDERGRFRANVLEGRQYAAWATGDGKDTNRVSAIVDGVFAGVPLVLREQPLRAPCRIRIRNLEAWRHWKPITIIARTTTPNGPIATIPLDANGEGIVPVLPGGLPVLRARLPMGCVLHPRYDTSKRAEPMPVRLPDVQPLLVRILRAEDGTPVAGARIDLCRRGGVAKTDEQGFAVCPGTPAGAALQLHVMIDGKDRVMTHVQRYPRTTAVDIAERRKNGEPDVVLKLVAGATVTGRLVIEGEPAAGVSIFADAPVFNTEDPKEMQLARNVSPPARVTVTDTAGRFRLTGLAAGGRSRCAALLTPDQLARLPAGRGAQAAVWFLVLDRTHSTDVGAIDLAKLHAVDVAVRKADGAPVDRPEVWWRLPERAGVVGTDTFSKYRADRRGRIRFILPMLSSVTITASHRDVEQAVSSRVPVPGGVLRLDLKVR